MAKPDPLAAYRAQGIPDMPVGTLDELLAHKLPTRVFPCCAEPTPDESVKGCPLWYECTMSYKGLSAAEGGGPRNHAWTRMKSAANGGGTVTNVQPCFWGVAQQENVMLNKETLETVADEGQDYEFMTTVPDPAGGRDQFGFFKWDIKELTAKVPPFTRPGQEQRLLKHEHRAKIIERNKQRIRNEHAAKQQGITGVETPLDKRGSREIQGSKAKG